MLKNRSLPLRVNAVAGDKRLLTKLVSWHVATHRYQVPSPRSYAERKKKVFANVIKDLDVGDNFELSCSILTPIIRVLMWGSKRRHRRENHLEPRRDDRKAATRSIRGQGLLSSWLLHKCNPTYSLIFRNHEVLLLKTYKLIITFDDTNVIHRKLLPYKVGKRLSRGKHRNRIVEEVAMTGEKPRLIMAGI